LLFQKFWRTANIRGIARTGYILLLQFKISGSDANKFLVEE